jgi:hypothetical protein
MSNVKLIIDAPDTHVAQWAKEYNMDVVDVRGKSWSQIARIIFRGVDGHSIYPISHKLLILISDRKAHDLPVPSWAYADSPPKTPGGLSMYAHNYSCRTTAQRNDGPHMDIYMMWWLTNSTQSTTIEVKTLCRRVYGVQNIEDAEIWGFRYSSLPQHEIARVSRR